jgi:hypothetical protein
MFVRTEDSHPRSIAKAVSWRITGSVDKRQGKPSIHLEEEPAIVVREPGPAGHPAPQNDQLMSERSILSLKPALRLEWRGQHGQNKANQRNHLANLGGLALR